MPFVQRAREFTSTLRFRLVVWITLVVFVMVVIKNVAIQEIERRTLRQEYDQFLRDSLDPISDAVANAGPNDREALVTSFAAKVKSHEYRTWFLQVYDDKNQLYWSSGNAPALPPPRRGLGLTGPYDEQKHRILQRKVQKASGEQFYVRCGYLQIALQEDLDLLNRYLLIASISILVFTPLGAYLIALRATRPIAQIIATTAHLQPSNLTERLPIRGAGDEIDQLSQTINGMLDRLASYINQNRDFVANAAHELRSPLAAIRSSVEVGLNHSRTPEEYAVILSDVMEEISRLAGLVNRLLILAEGDAGRLAGKDQATRLDKIVRESAEMFDPVAESAGVRLIVGDLAAVLVPGEEAYLRQVVRNLIDNAIKYNRNPGEVLLQLGVDPGAKQAVLVVKDTGIGIDPDVLPRIFERFYRADKARTRETVRAGSGLGLSICQTIIQALHGDIRVESAPGEGTTFTVRMPLKDDAASFTPGLDRSARVPVGS